MSNIVYLNGDFVAAADAKVSVLDRGFVFGDGVYEVIPIYSGHLFRLNYHLKRLNDSLNGVRIENPLSTSGWAEVLTTLIDNNGGGDQSLYLQVTRGVAPRDHRFPQNTPPTIFAMSNPMSEPSAELKAGIRAILVEDIRWKLCNIKAIALLPNILLRQQAVDAQATEALMYRDGLLTEGSASNLFVIKDGIIVTPPKSNLLLPGITRDLVVELCDNHQIHCEQREISVKELENADEVWVTSSTKEIVPVIEIDDIKVGSGIPGPVWKRLITLYRDYKNQFRAGNVQ
jgi:D-alanine transaminase